jgi:hypothetical protein
VGELSGRFTNPGATVAYADEVTDLKAACLFMAQIGGWTVGRACPLCPGTSDINLFCYCEGIIHFDAEISDGAFDFCMSEQKLDGPEIAGPPVD